MALFGSGSSIGVVRSYGEFKLDGASVRGNGTLVAGDVVESANLPATASLGGSEVTLLPSSRATLYKDHEVLQSGTTVLHGSAYSAEAGGLRVVPVSGGAVLQVGYNGQSRVTVAAQQGGAEVFTASGELIASLNPGGALAFGPEAGMPSPSGAGQAGADTAVQIEGTLIAKNGQYYVTMNGKLYQVSSDTIKLAKYVGKTIKATASIVSSTGTTTVVTVGTVSIVGAAAGGLGAGALGAIIGAGAAGGTLAGLAAAGTFGGSSSSTP